MRYVLLPLIAVFAFAPVARADDAAGAKAIIEKAIKARGGKPDSKHTATTWKDQGKLTAGGGTLPYTADWAFRAPDKYRFALVVSLGDAKFNLTVVTNGTKAWAKEGDKTEELTGDKLENALGEVYQFWVLSLAPLVTDPGFKLATAKGQDVDKKPTVGVKVARDKRPDITLYFDKDSGLLVKREMMVKDESLKKDVLSEAFFSGYKETGGKMHFTKLKIVNGGKTLVEATLSDVKEVDALDAKLFEKP